MKIVLFRADAAGVERQLARIADALERAFPAAEPQSLAEPPARVHTVNDYDSWQQEREIWRQQGVTDDEIATMGRRL